MDFLKITWVAGIIILVIFSYIWKHTYDAAYDVDGASYVADLSRPMPFPIWLLIILAIIAFTPFLNIIMFFATIMGLAISYGLNDTRFTGFLDSIMKFLNKQL